jgi:outer membrane receptor protein involved in Fe transport
MKAVISILIILLLGAGCAQPQVQPEVTLATLPAEEPTSIPVPETPVTVTVQRIDSTKILITYSGSADADQLIELETTVISSKGSVDIRTMGSRLDTTPVQIGGTDIFRGPYPEVVRVLVNGYFTNGTHVEFLDTRI